MATTYVNPPEHCDLCEEFLGTRFYDCLVPTYGKWGNICHQCFVMGGCSLGTGRGQRWERTPTSGGKFVKTGG